MKVKSEKKQSVPRQGVKKQTKHSAVNKAVKNVKKQLSTVSKKKLARLHEPITADEPTKALVKLNRGVVYVGHIPHGFYEKQMQSYFEQFGKVTRVRVARSKKTGGSKGYGFVEFENCDVAEIAAQSMNNYLMSGRLLKATYIPPQKQHTGYFAGGNWSKTNNPNLKNRKQQISVLNTNVDHKVGNILEAKILKSIAEMERKLADKGIIYKIKPVGGGILN